MGLDRKSYEKSNRGKYDLALFSIMQDIVLSLLGSLLSVLLIRWLSEPKPGFIFLVLKYLSVSAIGIIAGVLISGCSKDIKRYATVRSIAKVVVAILIKEIAIIAAILLNVISLSLPSLEVLLILADLILTGIAMSYIRISARLMSGAYSNLSEKASRKTALVSGTSDPSLILAGELEKDGYNVMGLLTRNKGMEGRVIHDYVVYYCRTDEDLDRLQWRLGGVDGVFFPKTEEEIECDGSPKEDAAPQTDGMSLLGHMIKRSFDIGFSGLLLIVFSPVIAVCAFGVHLEDGGPAIFKQERIGRSGQPFFIYKFRSMRVNAETNGEPALYSGEDDPRLTRTGRFLRAHHLDELPQLWNIFKGDMSFIGYRPERRYYIDQIMNCNARYRYLYQIRPGITSYATLYNGYTDTMDKMLTRLDMDLYYLRNHSVWFDIKVLGLTFLSIVSGKKF